MDIEFLILETEETMIKALESYVVNLHRISTGRANPMVLNSAKIEYYGTPTPVNQLAAVSVPKPNQLLVKPYDSKSAQDVGKAITALNMDFQVNDEGNQVRIIFPVLTTERRHSLVKNMSKYTEQTKVLMRQARQNANKLIKKDNEISENNQKDYLDQIQKLTDSFVEKINIKTKEKKQELMTI